MDTVRVRVLSDEAKMERALFVSIVYGDKQSTAEEKKRKMLREKDKPEQYMAFLAVRVRKDIRHKENKEKKEQEKAKTKDAGCMDRRLFTADQMNATLAKYETPLEALVNYADNTPYPAGSTTVYVSLNARDHKAAFVTMMQVLTTRVLKGYPTTKHMQIKNYQQNHGLRGWNLLDMDAPKGDVSQLDKDVKQLRAIMDDCLSEFFVIRTKGGYHWIFHKNMFTKTGQGKDGLYARLKQCLLRKELTSIDGSNSKGGINSDAYTVVPGTVQRGHHVTFARELCKGLEVYMAKE